MNFLSTKILTLTKIDAEKLCCAFCTKSLNHFFFIYEANELGINYNLNPTAKLQEQKKSSRIVFKIQWRKLKTYLKLMTRKNVHFNKFLV